MDWLAPPILAAAITSLVVVVVYFLGRFRENKLRFIAEKRAAYTALIVADLEQRTLTREMARLLADRHRLAVEGEAAAITSWQALLRKHQGRQLSEEQEAEQVLRDAEVQRMLDADAEVRALVEAGDEDADLESLDEIVDAKLQETTRADARIGAKLDKVEDRKEEAAANLHAALAAVTLLAPRRTTAGFESFVRAIERSPTSDERSVAMDRLVDAMRKDLGLGPRWRRRPWWRSPKRVATPEST